MSNRKSPSRAKAQTSTLAAEAGTNQLDNGVDYSAEAVATREAEAALAEKEADSVGTDQQTETPADPAPAETPAVAETVTKKKRRLINPQPVIDRKVAAVEKVGGRLVYQDRKWVLSADDKVISRMASTDFALILPSGFVDKITEARAAWAEESQEG
jgi:hypothetical protein